MSDPVADFLAREQHALADLDDDALPLPPASDTSSHHSGDFLPGLHSGGGSGLDLSSVDITSTTLTNGGAMHMPKIEPEKMRKWREEQKLLIEKKDALEEKERDEWRSSAKKELDDWYRTRAEQLDKSKKANRSNEENLLATHQRGQTGTDWEQIGKLCEFNPKNAKNTKDVSRLRSLLLQLKQSETANK